MGRPVLRSPTAGSQQGIEVQRSAIFEHEGPLQFVGQFPDIARPAITQKPTPSRLGNRPHRQTVARCDSLHQRFGQRQEVGTPVPQWRNGQPEQIESMLQIRTEPALGDQLSEILVGGGDDPHIDSDVFRAANATDAVVFQHGQQLGLNGQRKAAEFVEEQGAPMGRLEQPDASAAGIGECPLLVAEEFRLGQMLGNCRAIDLHPRPVSPRTFAMDPTGQRSLAGARLAFDEHRR